MKKRLLAMSLTLTMLLTLLPTAAFARDVILNIDSTGIYIPYGGYSGVPFRLTPDGDIQGNIPYATPYEVIAVEGKWGKIRYQGGEYYVWGRDNKACKIGELGEAFPTVVHYGGAPGLVKTSDWARATLTGLTGVTGKVGNDWTKPITRVQMAGLLVDTMVRLTSVEPKYLPLVKAQDSVAYRDTVDRDVEHISLWGITSGVSAGVYDPNGLVTREQMATFLYNLSEYNWKTVCEGASEFSLKGGSLKGFSDAGKVSSWAKTSMGKIVSAGIMTGSGGKLDPQGICTIEQAQLMCIRLVESLKAKQSWAASDGNYTLQSAINAKPNLLVDASGKLTFSAASSTVFTLKRTRTTLDGTYITLRAPNGRYVGTNASFPLNGEEVVLVDSPYEWLVCPGGIDTKLLSGSNDHQMINAPGYKTDDGTVLVTWYTDLLADDNNGNFIFNKAK